MHNEKEREKIYTLRYNQVFSYHYSRYYLKRDFFYILFDSSNAAAFEVHISNNYLVSIENFLDKFHEITRSTSSFKFIFSLCILWLAAPVFPRLGCQEGHAQHLPGDGEVHQAAEEVDPHLVPSKVAPHPVHNVLFLLPLFPSPFVNALLNLHLVFGAVHGSVLGRPRSVSAQSGVILDL